MDDAFDFCRVDVGATPDDEIGLAVLDEQVAALADAPSKFVNTYRENFEGEVAKTPLRRIGGASEVASVIAFLCSDDASFVTGETITVSGGWYMRP